ncbi:MAG: aldo/keto reductase [Acidobacteria bacterium]|nr:aldo/keto reductase [Acidobacteriota bacterium]
MEQRSIGSLQVSVIGLGCNNFGMRIDEEATAEVVTATLDAGINFFDTADSYGPSEQWLGKALAGRRDEAVVATKFGSPLGKDKPGGAKPDYVRTACERSLGKLGIDVIDLYQLHRPDPETPIGDTLAAMDDLVRAGKVREIGCSNFSAAQLVEADKAVADGAARFLSVQNNYNLLNRADENDALPEVERQGLAYLPFFPLASGVLSGKYRRGADIPPDTRAAVWGPDRLLLNDRSFDVVEQLTAWAERRGHSVLELAFAWLASKPAVASVIAGATKPEQVRTNAAAAAWTLTPAEVAEIEAIATPG